MQTIYIDISNKSVLPTIYAKQGDVGRRFKAIISNSGVAYQITSESFTASYDGASGSGNYDQIEGRSAFEVSQNTVVVELAPNIFQAPGDSLFCLTMKNGDDSVIGLWNIPIYTEEKPGFLGDPIGDYYPGISAVLYVDQSLDSKQKEKARKNVGAVGYERQQLSETEKDQARENIGAADFKFVGDSAAALDAIIEMQEALLNASGTKPDDYGTPYAVEYIKQELAEVAKAQARENIGAMATAGGTMSGAINMGGNRIWNMANPTQNGDAVNLAMLNSIGLPSVGVVTEATQNEATEQGIYIVDGWGEYCLMFVFVSSWGKVQVLLPYHMSNFAVRMYWGAGWQEWKNYYSGN